MGGVDDNVQTKEISKEHREALRDVLRQAIDLVEEQGIDFLVAGSIASNEWGRPSAIGDVDVLIFPTDAKRLLKSFDAADFETEIKDPRWLYKARKHEVTVDLIFELAGGLYLDDEMLERGTLREVLGTRIPLMAPEDYLVNQAMSAGEDTPDYWHNALGVIARTELDWDYVVKRASYGPRRVLALLLYAQSNDLGVPDEPVMEIFEHLYPTRR